MIDLRELRAPVTPAQKTISSQETQWPKYLGSPTQVAENGSNLLNAVAENMAQPNEESGSQRLTQKIQA